MTKPKLKVIEKNVDRVKQSQLGLFIKLIEEDSPLEEMPSMCTLSKLVSENFDVDCQPADLELFFSMNNLILDEDYETESRKQIYYKDELFRLNH
jgi:hypothetical protein